MKNIQQLYSAHEGPVSQVAFQPSGSYSASASMGEAIKLYDLLEARPIFMLHVREKAVQAVEFSLKGEFFCGRGQNSQVMVWQPSFGYAGGPEGVEILEGGIQIIGHKYNVMQPTQAGALDGDVVSERRETVY